MKYFIIAGEASGDLHGSHLMRSIQHMDANAVFEFWGGDKMKSVGGAIHKHIESLAFMGFKEVIGNLNAIRKNFKLCKSQIEAFNPSALILIDYPGFNLRMAEWAFSKNIRVYYYISPQLWAWKSSRIKKIYKFVERLFVILPFEKKYYTERGIEVSYYGHPLLDVISSYRKNHPNQAKDLYSLFPGSRKQEISTILPKMIEGLTMTAITKFYISRAPSIPKEFYLNLIQDHQRFRLFGGTSYELFNRSAAALVTSGTATLECALFEVPQVVCYFGSALSYQIAKRLVNIKYIALANLIMDRQIIKELVQDEFNSKNIVAEFNKLLDTNYRQNQHQDYTLLLEMLKTNEIKTAPDLIASEIITRLKSSDAYNK